MYVEMENLPDSSRVWVYQSDRKMEEVERARITQNLQHFSDSWSAHGEPLASSFEIRENRFIILAIDESSVSASGCSIDSSIHMLKEIEQWSELDLFNRSLIPFLSSDENEVYQVSVKNLRQKYVEGIWDDDTFTFNILADSLGAIRTSWKIPAKQSWLRRFMNTESMNPVKR